MADEIFALSPIAARPVQPSEQDYDAIKEAFMETSRGRWFLGEYAKRNRNSDTRMVLDAVARIEETIAAQKKPVRNPLLDEALASFRTALAEARDAASAAVDGLAIEQNLAPVRKGARVIREIAWRLREIGADGRICDLIDSQVAAIEGATTRLNPSSLADMLGEAFDRIEGKIATFEASDAAPAADAPMARAPAAEADDIATAEAAAETAAQAEAPTPNGMRVPQPVEPDTAIEASSVAGAGSGATETKTESDIETTTEAAVTPTNPDVADEPSMAVAEAADEPKDAFDASDEALLDMVALEMAAPDTDEAYEPKLEDLRADMEAEFGAGDRQAQASPVEETKAPESPSREQPAEKPEIAKPEIAKPESQKPRAEAISENVASWEIDVTFGSDAPNVAAEPAVATASPTATLVRPEAGPEPSPAAEPSLTPSLGSSLIASGIVTTRPRSSGPDPLAPIRRMSQNEKIAFFS